MELSKMEALSRSCLLLLKQPAAAAESRIRESLLSYRKVLEENFLYDKKRSARMRRNAYGKLSLRDMRFAPKRSKSL